MDAKTSVSDPVPFQTPADNLGALGFDVTAQLLAAAGDISLVIDNNGIIRDIAISNSDMVVDGFAHWVGRAWIDTVSSDTRIKVEQMLLAAANGEAPRWRQVNHPVEDGDVPIRYLAVRTSADGRIIAMGRDLRATAALQQRLLQAQQSMERDYILLRQAQSRYRQLFELSSEAVLIVDTATRRVTEANPAALTLVGAQSNTLRGRPFSAIVDTEDRDAAMALLGAVAATDNVPPLQVRTAQVRQVCMLSATMFRQDRGAFFLVRLSPVGTSGGVENADALLMTTLEKVPDPFVLTDESMNIIAQNNAFLDLVQSVRSEEIQGQPLAQYVGRPGIDLNLLANQLKDHGSVRNFATIVRGRFGMEDDVELSAVATQNNGRACYGISVRLVGRLRDARITVADTQRSVEQLTELVGRVSLKEIVRESTDLIERLCIEAALNYTSDNRASAAEILGLSRQSLYSKLHRHGLASPGIDPGESE